MHAVCERAQRRAYRRRGAGRERAIGRVKHDVRQRAAAAAHAVAKARAARLRQAAIRCRLELLQRRQLASKRRQLQHGQLPRLWCAAALRVFVAWPWVGRLSSVMRVRRAAAPAVARLEHLCNAPFRWRRRRGVCNRQHERLGVGEPHQPKVELRCQQCHARPRRVCTHDDWHRRAMLYLHTQHMLLRPGRARRRQERHLHVQLGQRGNLAVRRPHRHRRRQRTAAAGCTGYAAARLLLEAHGEVRRRARRVVQRHDTRGGATSGEHAGQQQRARRDVQRQRHPDALQPQLQQRHCVALPCCSDSRFVRTQLQPPLVALVRPGWQERYFKRHGLARAQHALRRLHPERADAGVQPQVHQVHVAKCRAAGHGAERRIEAAARDATEPRRCTA
mmetsp:Transcript_8081/g.24365  ORF Transcript_8081/g.24365 Transcript_8081/m.24365 type:complete len:391 (-) Transcript_8081:1984-3156(-)